jgi:hypothetical protein
MKQVSPGSERLPKESIRAYRAFCIYRDLGAARSLDKAWRGFQADQGKDATSARRPGHWADWSQKFDWFERAQAYDDLIDEERRIADAAQRQDLQLRRAEFAVEEQQQKQNRVRKCDALLETAFSASRAEVTHVKKDNAACTKTTTKMKPPNFRDIAALMDAQNKTAKQAIEGVDSKNLEREERQIERVVWAKALQLPIKGSKSGPANVQPIAGLVSHPTDSEPDEPPFQKDKAA